MKRAVILERVSEDTDAVSFRVIFWIPVPTGRELYYRDSNLDWVPGTGQTEADRPQLRGSKVPNDLKPTDAELSAIREGRVVEVEDIVPLAKKSSSGVPYTVSQFKSNAASRLSNVYAGHVNNVEVYNPKLLYGSVYSDEKGWELVHRP